jgi:hypothetical protein
MLLVKMVSNAEKKRNLGAPLCSCSEPRVRLLFLLSTPDPVCSLHLIEVKEWRADVLDSSLQQSSSPSWIFGEARFITIE